MKFCSQPRSPAGFQIKCQWFTAFSDICRMKRILLCGAGKSATVLIDYLLQHAPAGDWRLTVADANLQLAREKVGQSAHGEAVSFDITDETKRREYITEADIVISMLPPFLHTQLARDCVALSKNLLTASYVDEEMRRMEEAINQKGLLFLCEMGLDPGIDHMSAMRIIDGVKDKGGKITSFKSHCGGLVAPESDTNPWHYKISWNPRNIVMAGKAGAIYKDENTIIKKTYEDLFERPGTVEVKGHATYAYYPNRDSLSYMPVYGLDGTHTFLRTTLRHPAFCKGWNYIVKAGLTHEEPLAGKKLNTMNCREALDAIIAGKKIAKDFEEFRSTIVAPEERALVSTLFAYLGLMSEMVVPAPVNSPADLLQYAVEHTLMLQPEDKDMIVMLHQFEYMIGDTKKMLDSSLVVKGEDSLRTAMAKTVGLPLGIAARLILKGQINLTGLHIPTHRNIYDPVLKELEEYGIRFLEN
jgi:saccharopine dehydrogenase-like NADP-dependent oxidoreductase